MKLLKKLISVTTAFIMLAGCSGSSGSMGIGTGRNGSNYYSMGEAIAASVRKEDSSLVLEVLETAGADENIRSVSAGKYPFAIVQADILGFAVKGEGMFNGDAPYTKLRAVSALYPEAIHIICLDDGIIREVSDLRDTTVGVGEPGSGTEQNAFHILIAHGINESNVTTRNLNTDEACEALKNGEISAFFYTSGAPAKRISQLAEETPIRVLPIEGEAQKKLLADLPFLFEYGIPAGTYQGMKEDIQTLAVMSVLITSEKTEEDLVNKVVRSLYDDAESIGSAVPVPFRFTLENAAANIPVSFHAGAAKYYREQGIEVPE